MPEYYGLMKSRGELSTGPRYYRGDGAFPRSLRCLRTL